MPNLTDRVDRLEKAIMELVYVQHKTEMEIQSLRREMKEFKDEMKEFKNRMDKEVKRINKHWGELANKMGTIVEDIIFPATRLVIRKYFECDPIDLMMNVERKRNGRREEFDVVAVCEDKVFLIEVKSTLRQEYIVQVKEKAKRFKELFPEYNDKELILILGTLSIKRELLNQLTKEGIYGMAYRECMDILNFEELHGKSRRSH